MSKLINKKQKGETKTQNKKQGRRVGSNRKENIIKQGGRTNEK